MILDVTTDSIEFLLGAAHTTRPMQFYASYHTINHTTPTIVPKKNFGSSNGTTAVTIIPAPSSGEINQLKFCSIYNCDSIEHTITARVNSSSNFRTVYQIPIKSGEQIQYTNIDGWKIYNMDGILKTANAIVGGPSTKMQLFTNISNAAITSTHTSGTDYAYYLGKADRNYDSVTVNINVGTALGATITWAEAAIYKGYPSIGSNVTLTRCGWVDISTGTNHGVNATGTKTIVIPILDKNLFIADEIWFVIGTVTSGTNLGLRTNNVADNIGSGLMQTATGSLRPSTNSSISFTLSSTGIPAIVAWHGAQNV